MQSFTGNRIKNHSILTGLSALRVYMIRFRLLTDQQIKFSVKMFHTYMIPLSNNPLIVVTLSETDINW